MKKKVFLTLCLVLCVFAFSSCQNEVKQVAPVDVEQAIVMMQDSITHINSNASLSTKSSDTYIYPNGAKYGWEDTESIDIYNGKEDKIKTSLFFEDMDGHRYESFNEEFGSKRVRELDAEGNPVLDDHGNPKYKIVPNHSKHTLKFDGVEMDKLSDEASKFFDDFTDATHAYSDSSMKNIRTSEKTGLDYTLKTVITTYLKSNDISIAYTCDDYSYNVEASYMQSGSNTIFKTVKINGMELSKDLIVKYHDTLEGLI